MSINIIIDRIILRKLAALPHSRGDFLFRLIPKLSELQIDITTGLIMAFRLK